MRVFPTRVGMNRPLWQIPALRSSIPHTRGDEPLDLQFRDGCQQYSPHAWG
ncbi:hypothetical protein DESPIG_00033 [Desulfovibrio piger ATCC 29098]|uniref:Uncharacterized protein n=1 Tax=Desulfovibrio piger ATCC 29098 TaxID=411464 RepID=B6WPR8_9BACT|nr:hypothetical protein DESPIG_00033 [Desulfovibrio piger ATCC 29098]